MQASFFKELETDKDRLINNFFRSRTQYDILSVLKFRFTAYLFFRYHKNPLYKTFAIPKKSGGERIILSPNSGLKELQRRLNAILQVSIHPKSCSHGFLRGRSIITNATKHLHKRFVINIDISNFFPAIHFGRVKGIFKSSPFQFDDSTANFLANVCTYEGSLPQGAPTSPIISNFICRSLDNDLLSLCIKNKCTYTRYADDITISTSLAKIPEEIGSILSNQFVLSKIINEIILSNGFEVNTKKTRLSKSYQSQIVTGLKVNEKLNVDRIYIRKVRAMLSNWRKYTLDKVQQDLYVKYHSNKDFIKVLQGRLGFIGSVKGKDNEGYLKLLKYAKTIDSSFKVGNDLRKYSRYQIMLCTEGKTDWKHLKKALLKFKKQGDYVNLNIDFREWSSLDSVGANELLTICESTAKMKGNNGMVIFLFDNDLPDITKKVKNSNSNFKIWANNVYSCVLPNPRFKRDANNICIEHFYSDEDIKTRDVNGRRLYLSGEFNKKTMRHLKDTTLNCVMGEKSARLEYSIIDSAVYNQYGENVALSKENFANNILKGENNFENVNFDEFRIIFNLIEEIEEIHFQASSMRV